MNQRKSNIPELWLSDMNNFQQFHLPASILFQIIRAGSAEKLKKQSG